MQPLFVELLQVSLGSRTELSRIPSEKEWNMLFVEAQRQAVIGVLTRGIGRLPKYSYPSQKTLFHWIGVAQMMEDTYELHCKRIQELMRLITGVCNGSCVLKGIGIAEYYPIPSCRQEGDIDLWVDVDRKDVVLWLKDKYTITHSSWHNLGVHFFDDISVELHFHPGWLYNPFYNKRLQKWFESEKNTQMKNFRASIGVAVPSNIFVAVYSMAHAFRHFVAEGIDLRHIVDYYYILRDLSDNDKKMAIDLLKRFGLLKYARGVMWLLLKYCGSPSTDLLCEPDEKEGMFLYHEVCFGCNMWKKTYNGLIFRMLVLFTHYPNEIIWVIPWKIWHKCWRILNV